MPGRPEKTREELARRLVNDVLRGYPGSGVRSFFRDDDEDDYADVGGRQGIELDIAKELISRRYFVNIDNGTYTFAASLEELRDAARGVKETVEQDAEEETEETEEKPVKRARKR